VIPLPQRSLRVVECVTTTRTEPRCSWSKRQSRGLASEWPSSDPQAGPVKTAGAADNGSPDNSRFRRGLIDRYLCRVRQLIG
jgi:hypothetical protein